MKDKILPILLLSSILVSCSSVYKSGQTPDDVYYSPAREVVKTEQKEEEKVEDKTASTDDQYLKMKVRDRVRWTRIDDYDYWVDTRYNTNCSCTCNPPTHNLGYSYGYYPIRYNTTYYYTGLTYYNPHYTTGSTSASNIKAYGNHTYSNTNSPVNPKTGSANNSNSSLLKRVFTSSGSNVDRPQRTIDPPTPSSSSSGTSSSAGGKSGGYGSSGSSTSGGRGGRGN